MPKSSLVKKIIGHLEKLQEEPIPDYSIPGAWLIGSDDEYVPNPPPTVSIDPYTFMHKRLTNIMEYHQPNTDYNLSLSKIHEENHQGTWIAQAKIYAMYVRTLTAWDHNNDDKLGGHKEDITLNADGIRETGTFLKTMLLLPYIKNMGCNTIYLLPVSQNDTVKMKGELPSPYAQKNPFNIEERLGDPLSGLSAQDEFKALVEAAHRMGIRVMLDFIFRTASRGCDWIQEHPDWFYWIDKKYELEYSPPFFTGEQLHEIHEKCVDEKNFDQLIQPDKEFRSMFKNPPAVDTIKKISDTEGYQGKSAKNRTLIVPGAFADWPPDDIQPPWSDVTYLKLFLDKPFNYIAYNTVRMYDTRIQEKNTSLWNTLESIIPFYQKEFGIDGARIDMGHALPDALENAIIQQARETDPDFSFLSEDFNPVNEKALEQGYNALWASGWYMQPRFSEEEEESIHNYFIDFIEELQDNPLPVLGSPETFDTPRAITRNGNKVFARLALYLNGFLPHVIPFIPAGMEFFDSNPCNLGLDFEESFITSFKGKLALFDRTCLQWENEGMQDEIKQIYAIREGYKNFFTSKHLIFQPMDLMIPDLYSYILTIPNQNDFIWIIVNFNMAQPNMFESELPFEDNMMYQLENLLTLHEEPQTNEALFDEVLEPGEVRIYRMFTDEEEEEEFL